MKKICAVSGIEFEITPEDLEFYEKMGISAPTLCPAERERRRLAWRNEQSLYSRKCDLCQKNIISIHHEKAKFPVYCNSCWFGDKWDGLKYGKDFDFSRPFFPQFRELYDQVPQIAIINDNGTKSENCEYCQDFSNGKNCYLVIGSWFIKDSFYSLDCNRSQDIMDCRSVNIESELCYECIDCVRIYRCAFLQDCQNCHDSWFLKDCIGCSHCFGCVNLRQKQYYFLNEKCTQEEYQKKIEALQLHKYSNLSGMRENFVKFVKKFPHRFAQFFNTTECQGDHLYNCKNTLGFNTINGEDSKFVDRIEAPKHCYDIIQTGAPQWCCDCITPDSSYMVAFSSWCWNCKNIACSDNCRGSGDLFGCISLQRKNYCILNKQYSKEEYFALREKIIEHMKVTGEWGEFFPIEMSPFGYNESNAMGYHPLSKEEVLARGLSWKEKEKKDYRSATLPCIPDSIDDVTDAVCNEILACETCQKNYKIQPQELKFYQKMRLPIPHKCFDCRHADRIKIRNPQKLFERKCDECGTLLQTTFALEKSEKVLCEKCYSKVVN
ncbi:hypothetical protein K9L27_04270 [Candidatus Gracilibacteria bacterium]|nr:hypothetical protein [Candidatus Gracilibacteria bacterium]